MVLELLMKLLKIIRFILRVFIFRIVLTPILSILIGVKFPPSKSFKLDRQFIIIANHNSHLDTLSLLCALPISMINDVYPAAASDYFARNKACAKFFEFFVNTVFVRRKSDGS